MASKERPYRSHLQPACEACRQRKSRCTLNSSSTTCLSCQVHRTTCSFDRSSTQHTLSPGKLQVNKTSAPKRRRLASDRSTTISSSSRMTTDKTQIPHPQEEQANLPLDRPLIPVTNPGSEPNLDSDLTEGNDGIAHVVGPITAFDNDILEKYLSSITATATPNGNVSRAVLQQSEPLSTRVMFDTVRKRPLGARDQQSLAASKCEMIEQLIGPSVDRLVDLHFRFVNKNFPLFDEDSFRKLYQNSKSRISPALLCNLYASALPYWNQSVELSAQRRPDICYVWFLAAEALYSEMFLAPGMSVIIAMILNVNGRPSTSMLGNGGLNGFATSLAFSLGLNRSPRDWHIAQSEKHLRIRIWWQVVLCDKWFSFGYGTPSRINWSQFDVPYPSFGELGISGSTVVSHHPPAEIYLAFLKLTKVLDQYLDFVYCLDPAARASQSASSQDLQAVLTQWEESLEGSVREIIIHKSSLHLSGAANLRLVYLGTRLFLCKIQLDLDMKANSSGTGREQEVMSQRYMQGQRAAEDIVHFVKNLQDDQLSGFWSPICGFALTSATTFLLRSSLRSFESERNIPLKMAKEMMNVLRRHHVDSGWDLPEQCIKRWAEVVEKMSVYHEPRNDDAELFQEDFNMDQWMLDELFSDTWGIWAG